MVSTLFLGCSKNDVLQPSRTEIVGANLFLCDGPVKYTLDVKLISSSGVALYYDSVLLSHNDTAEWQGTAKVNFQSMYFKQECHSVVDASGSRKEWRDKWAASDNTVPVESISRWLGKAEREAAYHTRPVVPAEQSKYLSDFTEPAYRLTWKEAEIDWNAWCDFHIDTMFGGDALLQEYKQAKVTMFFGTDDLLLDAIWITIDESDRWLSFVIVPTVTNITPNTDYVGEIEQDIFLKEEWTIINQYESDEE